LSNGNVFVAVSKKYMYEVDTMGNTVWQYSDGPPKGFRSECAHPGIIALLNNPCGIANVNNIEKFSIKVSPNPSSGLVTISGLENESNFDVRVTDLLGKTVSHTSGSSHLDLRDLENGQYVISVLLGNKKVTKSLTLTH
jgi:hypothetical protein